MAKKIKLVNLKDIATYKEKLTFHTCQTCKKEYALKAGRVNYCPWGCETVNTGITAGLTDVNT